MEILISWLSWLYLDMSKNYFRAYKNFLKFGINFFSTPILIKSLFYPFKGIGLIRKRGARPLGEMLSDFAFLIFSCFFGAFIRIIFIIFGLFFEFLILTIGLLGYFFWLSVPFIILGGLVFGFKLLWS